MPQRLLGSCWWGALNNSNPSGCLLAVLERVAQCAPLPANVWTNVPGNKIYGADISVQCSLSGSGREAAAHLGAFDIRMSFTPFL